MSDARYRSRQRAADADPGDVDARRAAKAERLRQRPWECPACEVFAAGAGGYPALSSDDPRCRARCCCTRCWERATDNRCDRACDDCPHGPQP